MKWFIVDIMHKDDRGIDWVALLIDVDPDLFAQESCSCKQRWLEFGHHLSRDQAQLKAEDLVATRH